jgi:type I restriction enzyme, S subunit
MLGNFELMLPPVAEQAVIADHLDQRLAELRLTIDRITREIDLIREYRTRLVADVVTGQLDVRAAAATLPELVLDLDPLDAAPAGDLLDDDPDAADGDPDLIDGLDDAGEQEQTAPR